MPSRKWRGRWRKVGSNIAIGSRSGGHKVWLSADLNATLGSGRKAGAGNDRRAGCDHGAGAGTFGGVSERVVPAGGGFARKDDGRRGMSGVFDACGLQLPGWPLVNYCAARRIEEIGRAS